MKNKPLLFFSLLGMTIPLLIGCNHVTPSVIEPDIKSSFTYVKDEVDYYNESYFASTYDNRLAKAPKKAVDSSKDEDNKYNFTINEAKLHEFLALEYFGIYVYSCVNYCLQYKYEPNGINIGDKITGRVQNMTSPGAREVMKKYNAYNNFYFYIDHDGNDLVFECDWVMKPNVAALQENGSFAGAAYVYGRIIRDDNHEVIGFNLTCYFDKDVRQINAIQFDFVNKKLSLIGTNYQDEGVKNSSPSAKITEMYNAGTLNYDELKKLKYSRVVVGTADLTDDYLDINYSGYTMQGYAKESEDIIFDKYGVDESVFKEKYNEVYSSVYSTKMRNDIDKFNYDEYKRVSFLDDSLIYGFQKATIYVDMYNRANPLFVEKETLLKSIDDYLVKSEDEKVNEKLNILKSEINKIKEDEYLTTFSTDKYTFEPSDDEYYYHTTYNCGEFYYRFTDIEEKSALRIYYLNGEITSATYNVPHTANDGHIGVYPSGTETIVNYENAFNDLKYRNETLYSYARCEDCQEKYVWIRQDFKSICTSDLSDIAFAYSYPYDGYSRIDLEQSHYMYNFFKGELTLDTKTIHEYDYLDDYNVFVPIKDTMYSQVGAIGGEDTRVMLGYENTHKTKIDVNENITTIEYENNETHSEKASAYLMNYNGKAKVTIKRSARYSYDVEVEYYTDEGGGINSTYTCHLEYADTLENKYPVVTKQQFELVNGGKVSRSQGTISMDITYGDYELVDNKLNFKINGTADGDGYHNDYNNSPNSLNKDELLIPLFTSGGSHLYNEMRDIVSDKIVSYQLMHYKYSKHSQGFLEIITYKTIESYLLEDMKSASLA